MSMSPQMLRVEEGVMPNPELGSTVLDDRYHLVSLEVSTGVSRR